MLTLSITDQIDDLAAIADQWNALDRGIPFRRTDWLLPWWKHLGGDHAPAIVLVHRNDQLIGGLPLYRRVGTRTLAAMGDGRVCTDYVGPLAAEGCLEEVGHRIGKYLCSIAADPQLGWNLLDFDGAIEGDAGFEALVLGLRDGGCSTHVSSRMSCWRKPKDATWADHLRHHGKTQRRRMRRWIEKIGDSIEGTVQMVRCDENTPPENFAAADSGSSVFDPRSVDCGPNQSLHRLIDDVMNLHQKRWQAEGEPGSFADPAMREFLHDAMGNFHARGLAKVNAACIDGRTIAGEMMMIGGDRVAYGYSAGYDIDESELEPGRVVCVDTLNQMYGVEDRFDAVDFMRGDEEYKTRFTTESRRLFHLRAFAPVAPARWRAMAYRAQFGVKQWLRRRSGRTPVVTAKF